MVESNSFADYLRQAQGRIDSGELAERVDYRIAISRKLSAAREAVVSGTGDWTSLVKNGIDCNLITGAGQQRFCDWVDQSPDNALNTLQVLWADDDTPPGQRINAVIAGAQRYRDHEGRIGFLMLVSVLLMGMGPEYSPFSGALFQEAYDYTGYPKPPTSADEGMVYEHALGFLDQLIERSAGRLDNGLDAQAIMWRIKDRPFLPPPEPDHDEQKPNEVADLEKPADELLLDPGFLHRIETLLEDKRQVIFQGPPGTGKTFVARKLAVRLAGSPERVRLVQFHPSYAYEDFV